MSGSESAAGAAKPLPTVMLYLLEQSLLTQDLIHGGGIDKLNRKSFFYVSGIFFAVLLIVFSWRQWQFSNASADDVLMQRRNSSFDLAVAFATALRKNDPLAYELAHPDLWPKLDEWMMTHEAKHCMHHNSAGLIQGEAFPNYSIIQECALEDNRGRYLYKVKVTLTSNGSMVLNWDQVEEEQF